MEMSKDSSTLCANDINYEFLNVFKNPNKLPITEVFIERTWKELKKNFPKNTKPSSLLNDIPEKFLEKKSEILPALDKKWLPKLNCFCYEPYNFNQPDENSFFINQNWLFLDTLEYLLSCNYHQFWCTILFDHNIIKSLKSYLLNPVLPYQIKEIEMSALSVYNKVFATFQLVYERLIHFHVSDEEYMSESYGVSKLIDLKLLNLPIVVTLAVLYHENNSGFVHKLFEIYGGYTKQKDFIAKEIETMIEQNLIILQTLCNYINRNPDEQKIVPISLEKRPKVYSLKWMYLFVTYLNNIIESLRVLFVYHKPAVAMALKKHFNTLLPSLYVEIYQEIYDALRPDNNYPDLFQIILDYLTLSRWMFIELYHELVSFCLGEILKQDMKSSMQEPMIENYLNLLTNALDEEYFIYDYDKTHSVADQNIILEECSDVDTTRTQYLVACIDKLSLSISLPNRESQLEKTFNDFVPPLKKIYSSKAPPSIAVIAPEPQAGPSGLCALHTNKIENAEGVERKIQSIIEMFPYLGDGFVLKCLEAYNFEEAEVINAILENNLPPDLQEMPFDEIRIPPEPEPVAPILAYRGKKPEVNDALLLLDDKSHMKEIKPIILEGLQCKYDSLYDDEYDDRLDDSVEIKVQDNPLDEEYNPNRTNRRNNNVEDDDERGAAAAAQESSEEDEEDSERKKLNFCEDPALLRERREARYQSRQNHKKPSQSNNVKGNPKGQGQSKNTLINRQRKESNKSSMGNHNRKSGAQWKRNKGMIPS